MQVALSAVLLGGAWANHFDNGFQFDDAHTIENNLAIRTLDVRRFFTDATATSTLSTHQAYRPGLVTLHALDVARGGTGKPEPRVFHVSIFLAFVALCVTCFFLFRRVFDLAEPGVEHRHWALVGATLFGVHTTNAETLNYLSARSDSASTLFAVLAVTVHLCWPRARRWGLTLLLMALGFSIKEPVVMVVPLLGLTSWWFEEGEVRPALKAMLPAGVLMALLVVGSRLMTPPTWTPGAPPALEYIATQPFVVLHYAFNFLLPLNLVIDTDWQAVSSLSDDRVYAGLLFLTALLLLIRAAARTAVWRPVAFGLAWFLLTLAPTSLVPLGEVLNDHRPFFGTVGLCLAGTWALARAAATAASAPARFALSTVLPMALLLAHAWGVHQRNAVWGDDVVLWSQAAERAPLQGRNHLHHGTALMRAGKWQQALVALETAQRLLPDYPYIAINLGTTWGQLLLDAEAEAHFRKAIVLGPAIPDAYCFFAEWLHRRGRIAEASEQTAKGLALSPEHSRLVQLKARLDPLLPGVAANRARHEQLERAPTASGWLDLSLAHYQNQQWPEAVKTSLSALELEPGNAFAFNNICAAFNQLQNWDSAIDACTRALGLDPSLAIAANNLQVARRGKTP